MMGCFQSRQQRSVPCYPEDPVILAAETAFTVSEVEALYELFRRLSTSIIRDGLIHREEFQQALFNNSERNFFADRVFDLFDANHKNVIEFGEFIRSLSVFHPNAPLPQKIQFAFKLYDLHGTGSIEWAELKEMVVALLNESQLPVVDDVVNSIVDNTFPQADMNGDGKIDYEEWETFVKKCPALLTNMTLPYLQDITTTFPSFIMTSQVSESDLRI